jgi:excisionase family DNA binding protein
MPVAQNLQHMSRANYLTVGEVAARVRISNMTVYRLIKSGELAAVRVGKSFRVREEDLDAYLDRQYTQAG